MKKKIIFIIIGYAVICFCGAVASINSFHTDIKTAVLFILSLPAAAFISNIIHELGHFLFCKLFKLKVTRIELGSFCYDALNKKIRFNKNGFFISKCAFLIKYGLSPVKYFFVFMGGALFNILLSLSAFLLWYMGNDSVMLYSIIFCSILNIAANGLYPKSTDRQLLKEYTKKA